MDGLNERCLFSFFFLILTWKDISTTKLTYEWYANLTAGSLLPKEHLSSYQIQAQVAVYVTNKTHYGFQIENITVTDSIIGQDAIFLPFQVVYDNDIQFYADINDKEGSVNMKKSLAGFFLMKKNVEEEGASVVIENSTYGTCHVEYITKKVNSNLIVVKVTDEASCTNSPYKRDTNTPLFSCPSSFQEGVANQNEKTYTFSNNNYLYFSQMTSISSIHFQPFQALAEAHYVHVSQLLKLMKIEEVEPSPSNNPMKTTDIRFNTATVVYDPTSGRLPSNKTLLKNEIHLLLEQLSESLDWKLSTSSLDNQTSFHILELMWFLDVEDWEDLYRNISLGTSYMEETIQHLFLEFIPQVGSEASITFLKDLINSKKISGFSASHMLITFPLHVKKVSEEFLVRCEEFMRLDVEPEVRSSGILSFAVLVQNVCNNSCTKELLDRYTKHFLDKFSDSSNYEDQMVYLQGLSNMQNSRTFDYLSPIIGNPSYDRHIRHLAIGCIMRTLYKQEERAIALFWPLFRNTSEPLEIRVSAMNALITTLPSSARLLSFFWHMKKESNYHLYNFFYTTVQSYANTKYPCYNTLRHIASQLSRYLLPRAYRWATGNYILDYEDTVRGYGGLIKSVIIASEVTGMPSYIYLSTEQHSHGLSSKFSIQVKLEGAVDPSWKTLIDKNGASFYSFFEQPNLAEFLGKINLKISNPEEVHVEVIIKIDDNAVYCKHFNSTSFYKVLLTIKENSALYYEFSINYQRLRFPIRYETTKITEIGTPVTLQIRTSSVLSLRGSIKQIEKGFVRNADLDFRYSMNTVTSLKTLNIFNQKWFGADRLRSLHFRLPFSVSLVEQKPKSSFKITINRRNKDLNGSALGFVWHSTVKLFPSLLHETPSTFNGNHTNHWSIESRDLGARFDARVFDCQGENNVLESLFIIKEAFQLSSKNYKMMIGGVPILGIYSLANYFTFIPPGDSCGIIISMMPLQVQLIFIREGFTFRLEMQHETELSIIWRLNMHYKDSDKEGQTKINFQLEHKELANANNNTWRLSQLEGFFTVPSFRQGILKAPGAATGQAKIVWGSALQPTKIELELRSDNRNENWPLNCTSDSANCLQAVSNLATVQTVFLNCVNLPIWTTTALLSIFPENVQADKTSTKISFTLPAKLPWTTQGECVINSNRVLKFDNGTIQEFAQSTKCYSLAVADCSSTSQFIVGLKKISADSTSLELLVQSPLAELKIRPEKLDDLKITINRTIVNITSFDQFYPPESNATNFTYQYWDTSKMIEIVVGKSGLILQYYGQSVIAIAEYKLRGRTCGLCGDFNGEISNDDVNFTSCIENFVL
ncbi:hypothetical protein V9T40_007067 [Parthenolecanium corni]|uniref:Vitellogenin n=1 Tax=Parthenolecanium corni TaxID=536013 RepID=A0AAN9YBA5_9HEMI